MMRLRTHSFVIFLLLLATSQLAAQAPADLKKTMQERDQAVDKADPVVWDRLTADEFTLVDETGTFMTKAQRLTQLRTQKPSVATPHEREQVTGQGDVYIRRFLSGGQWVLDVWVRKPAGWRVTAVQVTNAKK
jgi:hypothetical protein